MTYLFAWAQAAKDSPVPTDTEKREEKAAPPYQKLCSEIFNLGDLLACYLFDSNGGVAGAEYGDMEVDDELKVHFGEIAAVIWGGLSRVEVLGGPLKLVTAEYESFKIIGIPYTTMKMGILLVLPNDVNTATVKDRVLDYLGYWLEARKFKRVQSGRSGLFQGSS